MILACVGRFTYGQSNLSEAFMVREGLMGHLLRNSTWGSRAKCYHTRLHAVVIDARILIHLEDFQITPIMDTHTLAFNIALTPVTYSKPVTLPRSHRFSTSRAISHSLTKSPLPCNVPKTISVV